MAGSADPGAKVAEPVGHAKISQVFQFLRALNEHRNPATRAIEDQLWSLRLRSVPALRLRGPVEDRPWDLERNVHWMLQSPDAQQEPRLEGPLSGPERCFVLGRALGELSS